jgi:nucleoside-diphosphate-sugar epimerase
VVGGSTRDLFYRINVLGTKTVLACAAAHRVPKFVYTSSAGNVYNQTDLIDIDERLSVPENQRDAYNATKAEAEALVLAANGQDGLHTVALRPAGIFGCAKKVPFSLSELSCFSVLKGDVSTLTDLGLAN